MKIVFAEQHSYLNHQCCSAKKLLKFRLIQIFNQKGGGHTGLAPKASFMGSGFADFALKVWIFITLQCIDALCIEGMNIYYIDTLCIEGR